jgi:hypothetical protein
LLPTGLERYQSWLSAALLGLTVVLLLVAVWVALGAEGKDLVGQLPLGASDEVRPFC